MTRVWLAVIGSVAMHLAVIATLAASRFTASPRPDPRPQVSQELVYVDAVTLSLDRERARVRVDPFGPEAVKLERATARSKQERRAKMASDTKTNPQPDPSTPTDADAQGERREAQAEPQATDATLLEIGAAQNTGDGTEGRAVSEGPPPPPPAPDLTALHARLAAAATRCYPAAAKRFRLRGTVPVHFCVSDSGALSAIELRGTSGHSSLDRAAAECVLPGAAPLPVTASCFDVPIAFR